MIKKIIESNFKIAIDKQKCIKKDLLMINAIADNLLDIDLVKTWMNGYGLFRGINNGTREDVCKLYMTFIKENEIILSQDKSAIIKDEIVFELFNSLHSRFFCKTGRKWFSATSKLLWCMFPNQIIMYDSFVKKAVDDLFCIDNDLSTRFNISKCPKLNDEFDIRQLTNHYMNFQYIVKDILHKNQELINQLKLNYPENYDTDKRLYDIRIIDKVLWLMGKCCSINASGELTCKDDWGKNIKLSKGCADG